MTRYSARLTLPMDDDHAFGVHVDHEFKNLIPAISDEERKQLEANVVEFGGARDPLVVWSNGDRDILIDGHNRYEICTRLGLNYHVEAMEFASRDEAADWIDRNQLGRRNLSRQDYKLLLGRRYNRAKKTAGGQEGNANASKNEAGKLPTSKTAEKLAREHGVDEKTVRRAGQFQAAVEKLGIEKEIAAGKVKASEAEVVKAAKTLPAKPTREQRDEARKAVATADPRNGKRKQADKPTAGQSLRRNTRLARKATLGLITVRCAVEELAKTDSSFRDSTLDDLQSCIKHLSQDWIAAKGKPVKRQPSDELRALVVQRWESMRLWGKHWGIADMKDVRRMFAEIIRDEQKQFDK